MESSEHNSNMRMSYFLACLLLTICTIAPSQAADERVARAHDAYKKHEWTSAFRLYSDLAKEGNVIAQSKLGSLYYMGAGVPEDNHKALEFFQQAGEGGNLGAMASAGMMLLYGQGGVPKNTALALQWYKKAAEKGLVRAQVSLAQLYYDGKLVTQDYSLAAQWFERAARQGDQSAQSQLANMYESGTGVPQDFLLAYFWDNLAASRPLPPSDAAGGLLRGLAEVNRKLQAESRDRLQSKLTPSQLAEAQQMSRLWKPILERGEREDRASQ